MSTATNSEREETKDWPQKLAIFICSLIAFTFGIGYSWSSPSIVQIVNDHVRYNITEEQASYFPVIPPISSIFTGILFSSLNDGIGRKKTLILVIVPYIVSYLLKAFASSVYVFYIALAIEGLGNILIFISIPSYIGEISTPKVRGSWGNVFWFMILLGEFFINLVGSYLSIQNTALICLIFPTIFLIVFPFMPESPYFLIMKNKDEDARKSLQFLLGKKNVDEEIKSLKIDVQRQLSEISNWKDLCSIESNRTAMYCAIFLKISQGLTGASAFFSYTQMIFNESNSNLSESTSSIIVFSVLPLSSYIAIFTTEKIGRRKLYIISELVCSIALFVQAIYFYMDVSTADWILLFGLLLFFVSYSIGVGIVSNLMLSELFSVSIKGKALLVTDIVRAVGVGVFTKLFQIFEVNFGLYSPYLFFGVSSVICGILSFRLIVETKDKTLEEIQQNLKHHF